MSQTQALFSGTAAVVIRRTVTAAVAVIALLTFAFGFGNGWQLGLSLGVPAWIAPLVAPAVDLSVIALLAAVQYLRARGAGDRLLGPRLLLVVCGLITFGLNTARAISTGQSGRACFDAIAPLLLIGWSEVGPRLLALLHSTVPDDKDGPASILARPEAGPPPAVSVSQLARAVRLDTDERTRTGQGITRDRLRAKLRVSNAVAGELLRHIRTPSKKNEPPTLSTSPYLASSLVVNSTA